nr:porin [uncultured Psychrobacter sp.]
MNKRLIAASIISLPMTTTYAVPEIYGKAFVTADYVDSQADYSHRSDVSDLSDSGSLQVNSNSSRLGFRGSEAITDNTSIIYQLEYGVDFDGEGSRNLLSRDTYLGLKGKGVGEFRFGRNSSILSYAYEPVVTRAYWDNLGKTKLGSDELVSALNMIDYTRKDNSVIWIAPTYKHFNLVAQYATNESQSIGRDDGFGASLTYDKDGIRAGVTYSQDIEVRGSINASSEVTDGDDEQSLDYSGEVIRATLTVDLDEYIDIPAPLTMGLLYQQADYNFRGSKKEKGLIASAKASLDNFARPTSVYLQYNQTDNLNGIGNNKSKQLVLGGEYDFRDNIIAHAYIGKNSADYTDLVNQSRGVADIEVLVIGGGLEYLF